MCGSDGIFHGTILKPRVTLPFSHKGARGVDPFHSGGSNTKAAKLKKKAADAVLAENEAVEGANAQIAASRRRRKYSSLFAGGRSVLGANAGRGAPGGGGVSSPGGTPGGGSAMGGSRSSGGSGFGNAQYRN